MAAVHLAERGLKPIVLEANPDWLGGRLKDGPTVTFAHQDRIWHFPGEHGVHGIWSAYVNFKAVLAHHDILPALVPAREETWIYGRGQTIRRAALGSIIRYSSIPAPFHYLELFIRPRFLNILTLRDIASLFRVLGSLFAAMSIDPLAEHKALAGMSLADFTQGWSPTLKSLFAGLARSALAAHPTQIPVSGFIAFLRFYTLLRREAWAFDYLPGPGGTCVIHPLAEMARHLGSEIRQGIRVVALQRGEETKANAPDERPVSLPSYIDTALVAKKSDEQTSAKWRVIYEAQGNQHALAANHIILALDAPAAKRLLNDSPLMTTAAAALHFPSGVATAIIRLWFKGKPQPIAEAGIYTGDFVMDNFFWLNRLHPAYMEWSRQTGGSALEMHIYGPSELLAQPDAALLAQVMTDTYRAYPELRRQLLHSVLLRNQASHTLFSVGQPGQHLGIQTPWSGIFACGDWIYDSTPALYLERATTTAIGAANALLTQLNLETYPILPHPEPEWLAGKLANGLQGLRRTLLKRKGVTIQAKW
jgi:isorenieratene synthase